MKHFVVRKLNQGRSLSFSFLFKKKSNIFSKCRGLSIAWRLASYLVKVKRLTRSTCLACWQLIANLVLGGVLVCLFYQWLSRSNYHATVTYALCHHCATMGTHWGTQPRRRRTRFIALKVVKIARARKAFWEAIPANSNNMQEIHATGNIHDTVLEHYCCQWESIPKSANIRQQMRPSFKRILWFRIGLKSAQKPTCILNPNIYMCVFFPLGFPFSTFYLEKPRFFAKSWGLLFVFGSRASLKTTNCQALPPLPLALLLALGPKSFGAAKRSRATWAANGWVP